MLSVMKVRENINCWEPVRFSVERKQNNQGGWLRIIYPHLLVWEAEGKRLKNGDKLVDCCSQ